MKTCPSDETLGNLLADALSAAGRDAVAEHVERCADCQGRLARLADISDTATWRRAMHHGRVDDDDAKIVERLKRALPSPTPNRSDSTDAGGRATYHGTQNPASGDAPWPDVPGHEILAVLGRGGMGVVYKARQLELRRIVAVKMLRNPANVSSKDLARFRAEADVIARLQHPNIVQIYEVGEVEGRPYFVLEYVAGGNLAQCLDGTPQAPRLAAQFVELLARAVHAAHANGVIHRDLKPANILLSPDQPGAVGALDDAQESKRSFAASVLKSVPKITDFGVAKFADRDRAYKPQSTLTATGDLVGTPSYMAPEQAAPAGAAVGPAADIYTLGTILYELLTGRPPFKGETPLDTVLQVVHNEPVAVTALQPHVPRDLETICLKCLRKEPHHRYHSASELADDLQSYLRGGPIKARPPGAVERAWRWVCAHPASSVIVAAGVLTPIVALVILSLLSERLVRSSALESAAQQAEVLETANNQYSQIVQRVEQANYPVNKMVPPTPGTVPLSIPATFLHDVGEGLSRDSKTGIQVRQFSDYPFPWRKGGPRDDFERRALDRLRDSKGQETVHEFTEIDNEPVVRYAQARIMKQSCIDCHNTHPLSTKQDWQVGDVRGVLEIIRPLKNDEDRIKEAFEVTLLLSIAGPGLLLLGGLLAIWARRRQLPTGSR